MSAEYILGYDPGGKNANGIVLLEVKDAAGNPSRKLAMATVSSIGEALDWVAQSTRDGRILACGMDTLTAWGLGRSGDRPAEALLRKHYKEIALSIVSPNSLRGSMAIGGAVFLSQREDALEEMEQK